MKKLHAIRVNKLYDNVEMQPEFISGSEKLIRDKLSEIKENPKRLAWTFKQNDHLNAVPKIAITEQITELTDLIIIAEANLTYITQLPKNYPMNPVWKAILIISIWCFIGLIAVVITSIQMAAKEKVEMQCYMHQINGVPTQLVFHGQPYKLNPDGTVEIIEEVMMNPEVKEQLVNMTKDDCIIVNH